MRPVAERKLVLFNGGGRFTLEKREDPFWQGLKPSSECDAYIAAYSLADAGRLIVEYLGRKPRGLDSTLRLWWNRGAWGNAMEGITPSRGIWVKLDRNAPVQIFKG